jgi:hypothetical protein
MVSSLPDDYATVERAISHRETIRHQTMDGYVKRYGAPREGTAKKSLSICQRLKLVQRLTETLNCLEEFQLV